VTLLLLNRKPLRRVEPFALPVDSVTPSEPEPEPMTAKPNQAA
jgi:hypothetical protein